MFEGVKEKIIASVLDAIGDHPINLNWKIEIVLTAKDIPSFGILPKETFTKKGNISTNIREISEIVRKAYNLKKEKV